MAGVNAHTEPGPILDVRLRALVTISVMAAALLQSIDTTIANVALPYMQGSMGVFQDQISWVITSYVIAVAIFIPLTSYLVSRLGRKRLFVGCVVAFTLISMCCGAAQDLNQLILFRFLQGMVGAPLVPLSQTIMYDTYPPEKAGAAMGLWGMGVMMGPIIGPTLGGWLTEYYAWRWVFYINLPLGLLTALGLWLYLPETPINRNRKFDLTGFVFLGISMGATQLMLDRGESLGWFQSPEIITEAIVAAGSFYLFVAHIATARNPFIDLEVFKNKNFSSGMVLMFFVGMVFYSVLVLLPPFMQDLMGYPILDVGILIAPRGFGTMIGMLLIGRMVNRIDNRLIVIVGFSLLSLSLWQMARFTNEINAELMVISGIIQGFGLGCLFAPLSNLTLGTLPIQQRNEVVPIFNLVRNLGGSIGIAVVLAVLSQNTQTNHEVLGSYITPFNQTLRQSLESGALSIDSVDGIMRLDGQVNKQALLLAYLQDFRLLMWVCLLMIPLVFILRHPPAPPGAKTIILELKPLSELFRRFMGRRLVDD